MRLILISALLVTTCDAYAGAASAADTAPPVVSPAARTVAGAPAISLAARLAATCAACHGTAGDTKGSTLPRLAGQSQQALSASMHDFKTGKRTSTIMTQIAKGYTDEQIEQLAAFFAAQKSGDAK